MNRVEKVTEALSEFDASIRGRQWWPGAPANKDQYAADRAALNKIRKQIVRNDYESAKALLGVLPQALLPLVPKSVRFLIKYEFKKTGA